MNKGNEQKETNMKKKEYIAPHIQLLHAETMANIAAASEQTVNIVDDLTEGTYNGAFYSKKHYDVWEED